MSMKMTIAHLYPDLLNLYGDRGNMACLEQRLKWRGMEVETVEVKVNDTPDFSKYDIVLLGGGVCAQGNTLVKPLQKLLDKEIFVGELGPKVKIRIAELGNSAGLLGAAALLM